jgi:hypothetical protein
LSGISDSPLEHSFSALNPSQPDQSKSATKCMKECTSQPSTPKPESILQ